MMPTTAAASDDDDFFAFLNHPDTHDSLVHAASTLMLKTSNTAAPHNQ